jgi:hypothetical protein
MSKAWCEKNRATKPQNYTQKEDMITARQANGTGPYMLKAREPDVKTVLTKNPDWWGLKEKRFEGNADEVIYTPIVSDATRVAALLSGEVDLVNDPPPQDVPQARADAWRQGAGRHREPDRVHRHGPGEGRAAVLEHQGQESVQGQARAPGALHGRRHRGDQEEHDARALAAVGSDAAVAAHHDCPKSRSVCRTTRSARRSCLRKPATRTASK